MRANSRGSLVLGLALIGLGVLFLAQQVFNFNFWDWLWPLLIVGSGGLFFAGMFAGGKPAAGLAIPGSIITTVGLIVFVMNITDRWEAWAYAWTLMVAAVGLGIAISGWWAGSAEQRRSGLALVRTGIVMFFIFGAFFELLIFNDRNVPGWLWPAALIAAGLYLLVSRAGLLDGLNPRRTRDQPPAADAVIEVTPRSSEDEPPRA